MGSWNFTPVSIIYFVAFGLSLLLAVLGIRIRAVKGARSFSFMMFFVSIWIFASMMGIFSYNIEWKLKMLKLEYFGMAGALYLWLIFVSIYTRYDKWLNKYIYILLAIIPVVTLYAALQAPNGTYIHTIYNFIEIKGLVTLEKNFAGGFYIWASYAYLMLLLGFVFIIFRIIKSPVKYRKQLYFISPIVFLIIIPNLFFITDASPIEPYDPTPLSLVVIGVLFLFIMYFHNFLSVEPVAQDLIFNNVKSGIVVVDNKKKVILINKVFEQIFGNAKIQLIGKSLEEVLPEISKLIESASNTEDFKTEIVLGPERRNYELKIATLIDKRDHFRGHVLMFWDITDQKMALSELDAYARTVAHDLKSPLSHIMGSARLLHEIDLNEKEKKFYFESIFSGGEKMRNIIDGLLMLAKIRNQDKLEKSVVKMEEVLESVIARMDHMILENNADISVDKNWCDAVGNSLWIEEVWVNLLSNALKYGGKPPVIKIGSTKNSDSIIFWISDNGEGLSEEEQSKLFSEFNRMHPERANIKGHGLGLSIVQRIISKMGGDTGVDSKKGEGSTFYFTLPIA